MNLTSIFFRKSTSPFFFRKPWLDARRSWGRAYASALSILLFAFAVNSVAAIGREQFVVFQSSSGVAPLVTLDLLPVIVVDEEADHKGVVRATVDLQQDLERVTGRRPTRVGAAPDAAKMAVIVGTVGKSRLIDQLVKTGKLETQDLIGKWEASVTQVIQAPLPGIERALVIAGSDKRGTIFGIYTLSEQIGVSPWYWWADVPVQRREEIFLKGGRVASGEPVVKYRGIFLNDEAPALTGWANEKFGGFNQKFYAKVFELMLRLRANYLWPAMWGSAFNDDDKQNPVLADEYGIVIGTSHHEPLMRAHDEWRRFGSGDWNYATNAEKLRDFWKGGVERVKNFEKIVSVGMRGDGDEAMSEDTNVALLERIVADQRKILADVHGRPPEDVPQLWALYKEVQGYYERGMRVPDDVTLLWCDDNWGNIRRLPIASERNRRGGAGVYYHFDYVGGPRNYKWLNTVPLTKIWEQMHLAWKYDANRIWIVNVGDLKPMEFPIEFFLTLAWDPSKISYEQLGSYSETWAAREFGPEFSRSIATLLNAYTQLNSRRKPEMLAPDTYSLVNYREADRVLSEWRTLVEQAERLDKRLPEGHRAAFFQLVLYPVKASAVVQELYVAVGQNRLYAKQGRSDAGVYASRARELFSTEGALVRRYHTLLAGKWNHMMSQVKFGYTYWQQPDIETMPSVAEVRPRDGAAMAVAYEGSEAAYPSYGARGPELPVIDDIRASSTWFEVFNRGAQPFSFRITANQSWVKLSRTEGEVGPAVKVDVEADWVALPVGESSAIITIEGPANQKVNITLPVEKLRGAVPESFSGHVEVGKYVAIEAPHYSRIVAQKDATWTTLPGFGRTAGAVTIAPVDAAERTPTGGSARIEYDVFLKSTGELEVELHCAPSLDYQSGEGLRFALSFDDEPPVILKLNTWETLQTWSTSVGDGVRRVVSRHKIEKPGAHVLKIWAVTPGVVVQRVVIDAGGVRPSYLGPIESPLIGRPAVQ